MEVYQRVNLVPSDPLLVGPIPRQQPQAPTPSSTTDATPPERLRGPPLLEPVPFVPPQGSVLLIGPLPRPLQPSTPTSLDLSEELEDDRVKPGSVPPPPLPQELLRVIPLQASPPLDVSHLGEFTGTSDRPGQSTTSINPQLEPISENNQQPSTTVLQDTFSSSNGHQSGVSVSEKRESVPPNTAVMENRLFSDTAQGGRHTSDAPHERRKSSDVTQGNTQRSGVSQGSRQASDVTQTGRLPFDEPPSSTLPSGARQGNKQPDIQAQQNIQPYGETEHGKPVKAETHRDSSDSSDDNTLQNKRQLNSDEQQISQMDREIDESKRRNNSEVSQGTEEGVNDNQENVRSLTVTLSPPLLTSIKRPPLSPVEFRGFSSSHIKGPDGQATTYFPSSSTAPTTVTDTSLRKTLACWKRVWDDASSAAVTTATISNTGGAQNSGDLPWLLESLSPRRRHKKAERKRVLKESQELSLEEPFPRIPVLPRTYLPVG